MYRYTGKTNYFEYVYGETCNQLIIVLLIKITFSILKKLIIINQSSFSTVRFCFQWCLFIFESNLHICSWDWLLINPPSLILFYFEGLNYIWGLSALLNCLRLILWSAFFSISFLSSYYVETFYFDFSLIWQFLIFF
jgi:hypothetical protein